MEAKAQTKKVIKDFFEVHEFLGWLFLFHGLSESLFIFPLTPGPIGWGEGEEHDGAAIRTTVLCRSADQPQQTGIPDVDANHFALRTFCQTNIDCGMVRRAGHSRSPGRCEMRSTASGRLFPFIQMERGNSSNIPPVLRSVSRYAQYNDRLSVNLPARRAAGVGSPEYRSWHIPERPGRRELLRVTDPRSGDWFMAR